MADDTLKGTFKTGKSKDVVKKNEFEVIGNSFVALYDGTRYSRERDTIYKLPTNSKEFYFLRVDWYDVGGKLYIGELTL